MSDVLQVTDLVFLSVVDFFSLAPYFSIRQ